MKNIIKVLMIVLFGLLVIPTIQIPIAKAQTTQCEGPAELCSKINDLQDKLHKLEQSGTSQEKKSGSKDITKAIAIAAAIAAALKLLLSSLKQWAGFFKTDKQKAALKVITLFVGLGAFMATNIGFGMPWWEALIVAGGGPGSMLIHDLTKLIEVFKGEKKYDDVKKDLESDLDKSSESVKDQSKDAEDKPNG
jgi:hypothetical protein